VLIASVVGARPQFVKLGMLDLAIRRAAERADDGISHQIIHTGQHYDERLSTVFFNELGIPEPDENLEVGSGSHGVQTGQMLEGLDRRFRVDRPDLVLTYGDTNSTLAAALAASKLHIAVAHVESGLRSYQKHMPEEINRVLTDHMSTLLFCPTAVAVENLKEEGLAGPTSGELYEIGNSTRFPSPTSDAPWVLRVGDVMYDSVLHHELRASAAMRDEIADLVSAEHAVLTVHRAENTDAPDRLAGILEAASKLATDYGWRVLFPAHPRTRAAMSGMQPLPGVAVTELFSYYDMLSILKSARIVLTDSGGVQREAFMLGTPCVTLRDRTEWVELLESGLSALGGSDVSTILQAAHALLTEDQPKSTLSPYGEGDAADRIIDACLAFGKMRSG